VLGYVQVVSTHDSGLGDQFHSADEFGGKEFVEVFVRGEGYMEV
jgi:hypothetical protein